MALSVLVALMMLAVPLASSSNLFVDGGQTNSNGDAPMLSASTGYTVTFQLNADGKSLDQTNVDDDFISKLKTATEEDNDLKGKVTWYLNENSDLCALIIGDAHIQNLIKVLFSSNDSKINKGAAYKLLSWKDADTGMIYDSSVSGSDLIKKDMIFASQWELQSGYVEVPVTVNFDGDVKEYVKAYEVDANGKIAVIVDKYNNDGTLDTTVKGLQNAVETVGDLSTDGYVINATEKLLPVYSNGVVTYGDNKALPTDGKIPSTSSLTVTYTFNDAKYAKLTVHSIAFKDSKDVMLYADKATPYDYSMILAAVQAEIDSDKTIPITLAKNDDDSLKYESDGVSIKTSDGKYLVTGWNEGAALLESTIQTTAVEFTLDAKLNGYNVVFMVNGQYEVKFVEFGKLSEDLCTLDVSGLNHWVWIPFKDVAENIKLGLSEMTGLEGINLKQSDLKGNTLFQTFSFASQSNIDTVEKVAASVSSVDVPSVVFVACFESSANTAYAIFDAGTNGYFGDNENVDRIVVTGKGNTTQTKSASIVKPVSNLVYEDKTVFLGYSGYTNDSKYNLSSIQTFTAMPESYEHIVTFYIDNEVSAKLYYKGALAVDPDDNTVSGDLVAFEYKGNIYEASVANFEKAVEALQPKKDGYNFVQWNDVDGKKVFSIATAADNKITIEAGDGFPKDGIKTDFSVYAQFDAKSYTIKYVNTFEGTQSQTAYVDQNVTLYGKDTFIHEGYTLKGWSTVPGNSGSNYDLGATYSLNGADYKKLAGTDDSKDVVIELYSVWEYNGGSDVPGGNTDGNNDSDNTALYLIAGMLAVIAILAIVGIVLMRKKN